MAIKIVEEEEPTISCSLCEIPMDEKQKNLDLKLRKFEEEKHLRKKVLLRLSNRLS